MMYVQGLALTELRSLNFEYTMSVCVMLKRHFNHHEYHARRRRVLLPLAELGDDEEEIYNEASVESFNNTVSRAF